MRYRVIQVRSLTPVIFLISRTNLCFNSYGNSPLSRCSKPENTSIVYCELNNVHWLETGVLEDAEYIYDNAIDVSIDMYGTKAAAASIYSAMKERSYSTEAWSQQQLHPTREQGFSDIDIVNFIFTLDLLNFSYDIDSSQCSSRVYW